MTAYQSSEFAHECRMYSDLLSEKQRKYADDCMYAILQRKPMPDGNQRIRRKIEAIHKNIIDTVPKNSVFDTRN